MRAVVTVVGKDMVGILSKVSGICAENRMNVIEVSQTILQDMFCMIMLVETADEGANFAAFADAIKAEGEKLGLVIHAMHEDVFNSMHRI
ncbi:MAG: ACT domain-containing protein [Clostridia bacterium]|nr:ACT domain-containing protein [Oscillospiraceae bacterium]MBQ2828535.1 ACT domain-containing protein [Clostridia bacterium]